MGMITAHVSLITETQLATNVDVSFMVDRADSTLGNPLDAVLVSLPWCSAVDAANLAWLALSPLLKALPMDVVATSCLTPNYVVAYIVIETELHETDRAVAFDWLALTTSIS